MADRYAILPAATTSLWSATSTWSASSGGATGASVPTSADNVIVDALSVAGASAILLVDATANCLDMNWTGATNTPNLHQNFGYFLNIYGNCTFISGMSTTYLFLAFRGTGSFTSAGQGGAGDKIRTINVYGTLTLQDNLNISNDDVELHSGTLDTAGYTVTACFIIYTAAAKTLTLGASIWNATVWLASSGSNLTLTANTSTINVPGTGAFAGGGITTYNIVNLIGTAHTISGSNTFVQLNLLSSATQTITFTDGTTQTITTPSLSGSAGHIHTLQGSGVGGWAIVKAGGGTVVADFITVSYSNASPAATWLANVGSTDGGNNTGWIFAMKMTMTGYMTMTLH